MKKAWNKPKPKKPKAMRTDETPWLPHYGLYPEPQLTEGSLHYVSTDRFREPLTIGLVPAWERNRSSLPQFDYPGYG